MFLYFVAESWRRRKSSRSGTSTTRNLKHPPMIVILGTQFPDCAFVQQSISDKRRRDTNKWSSKKESLNFQKWCWQMHSDFKIRSHKKKHLLKIISAWGTAWKEAKDKQIMNWFFIFFFLSTIFLKSIYRSIYVVQEHASSNKCR